MFVSKIKNQYRVSRKKRLCQGDILKDLFFTFGGPSDKETLESNLPYSIILSQDCDLKSDFVERNKNNSNDKFLSTLLICPAYRAEDFFLGNHIDGWKMQSFLRKLVDRIIGNDLYKRYHYLPLNVDLGIPALVIDFKHFYTVPRDIIYEQRKQSYMATVSELFRESLSQRFFNYLSRIGLPEIED